MTTLTKQNKTTQFILSDFPSTDLLVEGQIKRKQAHNGHFKNNFMQASRVSTHSGFLNLHPHMERRLLSTFFFALSLSITSTICQSAPISCMFFSCSSYDSELQVVYYTSPLSHPGGWIVTNPSLSLPAMSSHLCIPSA